MKKGIMNCEWINDVDGSLYGISLGSDFCAEHETGIAGIRNEFDINKTDKERKIFGLKISSKPIFGIDVRTIKKNSAHLFEYDKCLVISTRPPEACKNILQVTNAELECYWDSHEFIIVSKDHSKMRRLWSAFQSLDIAIFMGRPGIMGNACLNIYIKSRISEDVKKKMFDSDKLAYETNLRSEKTGIHKKIKAAGLSYFALSPSINEAGDLKFWLNPCDQKKYEAGWYTVDELEQWIKGEGPIVKGGVGEPK